MKDTESGGISRRLLLKRTGITMGTLALPGILAACGNDEPAQSKSASPGGSSELDKLISKITSKRVVIGSFGGTTEDARRKAFWDPFTKLTGVAVVTADLPGNLGSDMIMGKVPAKMDAYHASAYQVLQALDSGKKPLPTLPDIAHEDGIPQEFRPHLFQSFYVGYVPAMLPGAFNPAPSTWADFFDTEKFPGKRAWPGPDNTVGTREAALMGDGVPPDKVFPLDLKRAYAKLEGFMDHIVVYEQFPQAQSFLTSKTAVMSFAGNGLWKGLQDKGIDVDVLWDMPPILQLNGMAMLPDGPNPDAVVALAAFCADPARQAEFARITGYGPPSSKAFDAMSKKEASAFPNSPGRVVCESDAANLAKNQVQMLEENKKLFS